MSGKRYFVITNPENGWDCVGGVFLAASEEKVREHLDEEHGSSTEDFLIIHEKYNVTELE